VVISGMSLSLDPAKGGWEERDGVRMYFYPVTETIPDTLCGVQIAPLAGVLRDPSTSAAIYVSPETVNGIDGLVSAAKGYTQQLPGLVSRVIRAGYLSAVTITTLGFGDLVPVK
jgi:hypothetical protein